MCFFSVSTCRRINDIHLKSHCDKINREASLEVLVVHHGGIPEQVVGLPEVVEEVEAGPGNRAR